MKRILPLLLVLIGISIQILATEGPKFLWGGKMGGAFTAAQVNDLVTDATGNIYATGTFSGSNQDFDIGAGTATLTDATGFGDVFILKYSALGQLQWAKSFGGSGADYGNAICLDQSGNVWITGSFAGTVDFNPSSGVANQSASGPTDRDIFIAKFDTSGNYLWAGALNSADQTAVAYDILFNSSNSQVSVLGRFSGTIDLSPGPLNVTFNSAGADDLFLARYNTSGGYLNSFTVGGAGSDYGTAAAYDASGNLFITGHFQGTVDFDLGADTAYRVSNGTGDVFVAKYAPSNALLFVHTFGGADVYDVGTSITIDVMGSVVVGGYFQGTADIDPGSGTTNITSSNLWNAFAIKYSNGGIFVGSYYVMNSSGQSTIRNVKVDSDGNVYLTGELVGEHTIQEFSAGQYNINEGSSRSPFIIKLYQGMQVQWGRALISGNGNGNALYANAQGEIVIGGRFNNAIDFDLSSNLIGDTSTGGFRCFIAKYNTCNFPEAPAVATNIYTCVGKPITLQAPGVVNAGWYYSNNGNDYVGANGSILNPTSDFVMYAQDSNTCGSSRRTQVSVFVGLKPEIQILSNTTDVCNGSEINLSVSGAVSYVWSTADTTSAIVIQVQPSDTVFSVIGTDNTTCSDTASISLNILTSPTLALSVVSDTFCVGERVLLYDLNGTSQDSYQWSTGSFSDTLGVLALSDAVYTVTVQNTDGCTASEIANILTRTPVETGVTQSGNQLSAIASGAAYQWINCGTGQSVIGSSSSVFTPSSSGDYAVVVTDNTFGCSDTSACVNVTLSSISLLEVLQQAYPNPFSHQLLLELNSAINGNDIAIELFNAAGQCVFTQKMISGTIVIQTDHMPSGIYMLRISGNEYSYLQKLVKE